jgi:hypothetical protein
VTLAYLCGRGESPGKIFRVRYDLTSIMGNLCFFHFGAHGARVCGAGCTCDFIFSSLSLTMCWCWRWNIFVVARAAGARGTESVLPGLRLSVIWAVARCVYNSLRSACCCWTLTLGGSGAACPWPRAQHQQARESGAHRNIFTPRLKCTFLAYIFVFNS